MQSSEEIQKLLRQVFAERSRYEKQQKLECFKRLNAYVKPRQIVFAGSSLMEQFPVNELMMGQNIPLSIYNRGIGGYTTSELMETMQVCIYDLEPSYVFLNIGTNDLNDADYVEDAFIGRYAAILRGLKEHLPETKVYLLSYYPVNNRVAENRFGMAELLKNRTNSRIHEANAAVKRMAEENGVDYLDVNSGLYDENGELKEEFTVDGMHMYANGYQAVWQELLPILRSLI